MVSSTLGSPTKTCWNRRSSAGSFSMCSRYSSSVVAPTMRSSPRASIGLSMLPASIARVAGRAGADHGVQLVDERDDLAVAGLDLVQHGLEPLLELAAVLRAGDHRSRGRARPAACRAATPGTSPATIRWARPSTTAVLPTPGSPISTGLFLVRRDSTWTTRRISASRPITGSSLPSRARAVRSTPYFSSAWKVPSGSGRGHPGARRGPAPSASISASVGRAVPRAAGRPSSPPAAASPTQQVLGGDVLVAPRLGALGRRGERALQGARRLRRADASARWPGAARPRRPPPRRRSRRGRRRPRRAAAAAMPVGLLEQREQQVGRLDAGVAVADGAAHGAVASASWRLVVSLRSMVCFLSGRDAWMRSADGVVWRSPAPDEARRCERLGSVDRSSSAAGRRSRRDLLPRASRMQLDAGQVRRPRCDSSLRPRAAARCRARSSAARRPGVRPGETRPSRS